MTTNKQLRELAERATPGPWGWDGPVWGYDTENEAPWLIQERGSDVVITGEIQCSEANAEYIATASPEVITALLDENEALQAECEKLHQEVEALQGIQPEMPPMPPNGKGLPRYGVRWNGPTQTLSVPKDDGFWTPWHLAQAECEKLRKLLAETVEDRDEAEHSLGLDLVERIYAAMQETNP